MLAPPNVPREFPSRAGEIDECSVAALLTCGLAAATRFDKLCYGDESMMKTLLASLVAVSMLASIPASAQTDLGGLRGYVKDEQGGVLPGVTVTATGPQILAPVVGVTDDSGYYRLLNLPPGNLTLRAELTGFASYLREGILMRAGSTFSVDIEMKVAALTDTITVRAESPMIEVQEAKTSFSISGELLRAAPVTNRGLYSDAIDMVPGIQSRQGVDGSGVRVYYFMGSTQNAGYTALEGAPFGGFANPTPARTSMSTRPSGIRKSGRAAPRRQRR